MVTVLWLCVVVAAVGLVVVVSGLALRSRLDGSLAEAALRVRTGRHWKIKRTRAGARAIRVR